MKRINLFFLSLLATLLVTTNAWGGVTAGKYYTIKAAFTTNTNDLYFYVNGNGVLDFTSASSEAEIWKAVNTNDSDRPITFQSLTASSKYLASAGGLVENANGGTWFKVETVDESKNYYSLYGDHSTVGAKGGSNLRYIATWSPSNSNYYLGFGKYGQGGCFAGSAHVGDDYCTRFEICEVSEQDLKSLVLNKALYFYSQNVGYPSTSESHRADLLNAINLYKHGGITASALLAKVKEYRNVTLADGITFGTAVEDGKSYKLVGYNPASGFTSDTNTRGYNLGFRYIYAQSESNVRFDMTSNTNDEHLWISTGTSSFTLKSKKYPAKYLNIGSTDLQETSASFTIERIANNVPFGHIRVKTGSNYINTIFDDKTFKGNKKVVFNSANARGSNPKGWSAEVLVECVNPTLPDEWTVVVTTTTGLSDGGLKLSDNCTVGNGEKIYAYDASCYTEAANVSGAIGAVTYDTENKKINIAYHTGYTVSIPNAPSDATITMSDDITEFTGERTQGNGGNYDYTGTLTESDFTCNYDATIEVSNYVITVTMKNPYQVQFGSGLMSDATTVTLVGNGGYDGGYPGEKTHSNGEYFAFKEGFTPTTGTFYNKKYDYTIEITQDKKISITACNIKMNTLYYMKSRRTYEKNDGTNYYFKYLADGEVGKIKVQNDALSSANLFFLKDAGDSQVTLHAMNSQAKMGYTQTEKGADRICNKSDNFVGTTYTLETPGTVAGYPYALKTVNNNNLYLSNYGGTDSFMGLYGTANENGTNFNFELYEGEYTLYTLVLQNTSAEAIEGHAVTLNSNDFLNNGCTVISGQYIVYTGSDATTLTIENFSTFGYTINSVAVNGTNIVLTCTELPVYEVVTVPSFIGGITLDDGTTVLKNGDTRQFSGEPVLGTDFTINAAFGYTTPVTCSIADHKITVTYTFNGTIATDDKSGVIFINSNVRNSTNAASENYDHDNSDGNHKVYGKANDHNDPTQLWLAEKAADGKYTLRNLNTGRYLHGNGNNTDWYTTTETSYLYLNAVSSTSYYSFGMSNSADNFNNMNLRGNLSAVCGYKATGDQGSQWKVDVVGDKSQYTIYNVRVEGYLGEAANAPTVSPKSGVTPVGNRALTNGEAFFFLKANDPALTAENVNEKFTVNVPSGYECSLSYVSATQTIKVTATPTFAISPTTGSLSESIQGNAWNTKWTSTSTNPQVMLHVDLSNMRVQNSILEMWAGTVASGAYQANVYTLGISPEYLIDSYEIVFENENTEYNMTITDGRDNTNKATATGSNEATFTATDVNTYFTTFSITEANTNNKGLKVKSFIVRYKENPKPATFLWTTAKADGERYRIPAITQTANGKLIAVSDKRWGGDIGSSNKTSLVFRTSTNNGETWTASADLATGTGSGESCAFSDPAIVADNTNANKVVAFSCNGTVGFGSGNWINDKNTYLATARFDSEDGGATWNTTYLEDALYKLFENCSSQVKSLFISSGRILQSRYFRKEGSSYNRIYAALLTKASDDTKHNRVIYSDDFGQNWSVLGGADALPCPAGDEAKIEELPDGRIILSSRTSSGRLMNVYTYTNTETAEGYWGTKTKTDATISSTDGGCNGEILIVPATKGSEKCYLALQSIPAVGSRKNVTIYYKELKDVNDLKDVSTIAANWDGSYQVSTTTSAYSTMILQQNGKIGFFYEEYAHNDGYNQTYIPISIEDITNNAYTLVEESNRKDVVKSYLPAIVDTWTEGNAVGQVPSKSNVKTGINNWSSAPTATQLDAVFGAVLRLEAGKYYRLHQTNQKRYAFLDGSNIKSASTETGGHYSEKGVAALFQFEDAGNGAYYIKANNGQYIILDRSNPLSVGDKTNDLAKCAVTTPSNETGQRFWISANSGENLLHTNVSGTDDGNVLGADKQYNGDNSRWLLEPVTDYKMYSIATDPADKTPSITYNKTGYTGTAALTKNSFLAIPTADADPVKSDFNVTLSGYVFDDVTAANSVLTFKFFEALKEGLYWLTSDDTNYLTYDGSSYTTVASANRVAGSIFYINGETVKAQGKDVSSSFEYKKYPVGDNDYRMYKDGTPYVVSKATGLKIDVNGLNGSTRKYATLCAPFPVQIPAAFDAYNATVNTETGVITLSHITGLEASEKVIDAGTPVLIHSKDFSQSALGAAPYTTGGITYLDDPINNDTSTDFKGSFVKTSFAELTGNNYVLGASNGVIGFYKMKENANLRANSAYVQIPSTSSQDGDAKGFSISFEDDPTTIYELVDGQLVEKDAPIYNLGGQKISKLQKGINIVNGKKVYIK